MTGTNIPIVNVVAYLAAYRRLHPFYDQIALRNATASGRAVAPEVNMTAGSGAVNKLSAAFMSYPD